MKKYDFDKIIDRRESASIKWNVGAKELPMWVADMDFEAPSAVREAVSATVAHGVFGYSDITPEYYASVRDWMARRHGVLVQTDWISYCQGVVPAMSSMIKRVARVGANAVLTPPVYNHFFDSIKNCGRVALTCDLIYDGSGYSIDFNDLERKLSRRQTTALVLCNPHNPVGRIWSRDELALIGEMCKRYGVTVISDEIHCDIVKPGGSYTSFMSASKICEQICVVCVSPSKAFNIAGIQSACVITPNEELREFLSRGLAMDERTLPNAFAISATVAAYTQCDEWLDDVCAYIWENREFAEAYIAERIKPIKVVKADATYLLWIDCGGLGEAASTFADFLRRTTGLVLCDGAIYGEPGRGFLRMNLACPRSVVADGLERLKNAVGQILGRIL